MFQAKRSRRGGWLIAALALVCVNGCGQAQTASEPTTLFVSTITFSQARFRGDPDLITEFSKKTGINIKFLPYGAVDMGARRVQHLTWLKTHAATPDVYEVDIIDVGNLAPYALDLTPFLKEEDREHMPAVMANLTFGQRVVALPIHTDVGLLFYRTDLLKKYGYAHPPKTWDELEKMATRIQAGERRSGNTKFWGFVWEGSPQNEGLTYSALEWQASNGGGRIIEPDGTISVNNPWTIAALRRARGWVGTISPPAVTAYQMEDLANAWFSGRAAFMRNWPFYYSLGQNPNSLVRGKFGVTAVPAGQMGSAGALGGWQFMVSPYSAHAKEAVQFVQFVTNRETELRLGKLSCMPTRAALYDDPELLSKNPYFGWLKNDFEHTVVARPSAVTGDKYLQVSEAYKQAVHKVLTGEVDAGEAVAELEKQLAQITGFAVKRPNQPLRFTSPSSK